MKSNLPVFETKRLILREINESDIYDMYEYAQIPYVGPSAGWEPHGSTSHTKEVIRSFIRKPQYGQLGVYAIILKENHKMIGTVELHTYVRDFKAELGYTVSPYYWGHGYAFEASQAIIKWGFNDLHLKRIECCCFSTNNQSRRVCEKLGFRYEGLRRKGYKLYNGYIGDLDCYAMIDDEFYQILTDNLWNKYNEL